MDQLENEVGLGTFPFANVFTELSETEIETIVRTFLNLGGSYIDVAPLYGLGEVETMLGRILKDIPRDEYLLASKCGFVLTENEGPRLSGQYSDVLEACEQSLQRLNVDTLDFYMPHGPDERTPFEETMKAMEDLQKQGKIKEIGVSNVSLDQLKEYNKYGPVKFVQNRFSLFNQAFEPAFIDYCENHGIGITPYQVIERGLLTNKAVEGMKLREDDLRNQKPEFASEVRTTISQWVGEYLEPIAEDLHTSVSTLAIWWALQQPAITLCICGATNPDQVECNLKAKDLVVSDDILEQINASYQILVDTIEGQYSMKVRDFMGLS